MNHPFTAMVDPAACLPRNPTQGTVRRPLDERERKDAVAAQPTPQPAKLAAKPAAVPPPASVPATGYTPRFGSLAWRLVTYLRSNPDAVLSRAEIAEQFSKAENGVDKSLEPCVDRGFLARGKTGEGLMGWRAGANKADLPQEAKTAAKKPPQLAKARPPKASQRSAPAAPRPFNAALWLDGDLVIYGAQELEDGGMLINREQLARLKRLIAWSAPL